MSVPSHTTLPTAPNSNHVPRPPRRRAPRPLPRLFPSHPAHHERHTPSCERHAPSAHSARREGGSGERRTGERVGATRRTRPSAPRWTGGLSEGHAVECTRRLGWAGRARDSAVRPDVAPRTARAAAPLGTASRFPPPGRVRTKTVKRASRVVIEKYYPRLTLDFHVNKKICDEVAIIPSKRLRNKIAGFTTHLMKRIQKGPVRGISFKLQEEERERKDNYVPEVSALDTQGVPIDVDPETKDLLKTLGFDALAVNVVAPQTSYERPGRRNVVGLGRRND
ncbi:hypothetical protein Rhopal_004234-T1 [Rhodotorula paludigena]|uniref:40S ribosomal protein S17 n=1 Tax=Rhodotorula paludigena TaxID=86838 RepID=A0AAV5GFA4_9BASI|nr:hypothetical protein Rhopal_004234-T1 [Rhodotorula paludigena]